MTQYPFNREYSEQEAQKLNAESTSLTNEDELTDEEAEAVAGGRGIGGAIKRVRRSANNTVKKIAGAIENAIDEGSPPSDNTFDK